MTAVDTNVVVRLVTGDDPKQRRAAEALFEAGPVWISKTVLLETYWVLGKLYGYRDASILEALGGLLGLENVECEDKWGVASAMGLCGQGIEFADALHLTNRPEGARFATFDRQFFRRAKGAGLTGVIYAAEA